MKKITALLILFCFSQIAVVAQDTTKATYRITTPVLQDALLYFTLSFEKVLVKKTIGTSFGFRPSTQSGGETSFKTSPGFTYQTNNFNNKLYSSVTIDLFAKFYFGQAQKSFLMPDVYYRLWWFNEKDCSFKSGDYIYADYYYSYDGTRTERQNLLGLKVLYGRTYKLNKHGALRPIIEPYGGVGLFVKSYTFQTYNGTVNNIYYDYHVETDTKLYGSVHLGLNIGFEFDVKKKK